MMIGDSKIRYWQVCCQWKIMAPNLREINFDFLLIPSFTELNQWCNWILRCNWQRTSVHRKPCIPIGGLIRQKLKHCSRIGVNLMGFVWNFRTEFINWNKCSLFNWYYWEFDGQNVHELSLCRQNLASEFYSNGIEFLESFTTSTSMQFLDVASFIIFTFLWANRAE